MKLARLIEGLYRGSASLKQSSGGGLGLGVLHWLKDDEERHVATSGCGYGCGGGMM